MEKKTTGALKYRTSHPVCKLDMCQKICIFAREVLTATAKCIECKKKNNLFHNVKRK